MKKLAIVLVAVFCFQMISAKHFVPTKEQVDAFYKTKTLIVMEPNQLSEFNFRIKDIIKEHWTITEYDFIKLDEFEEKKSDPRYSFLMITQVKFDNDKTYSMYNFLSLLIGGPTETLGGMPDLCPVPVSYAKVEEGSWVYKLGALVRFMQDHVNMIHKNPELISANIFKHYNNNMGDIKNKTLYVIKDELSTNINTIAKFKSLYPYNVKFVSQEDIEKAVVEEDNSIVFLHKVGPMGPKLKARIYKVMIGAGDQQFYYFDFHMYNRSKKPDGLLASDLKKMEKRKPKKK